MTAERFDKCSDPEWPPREPGATTARPFLGVHFACCNVYARIYRNAARTHYVGHCPKCCQRIEFRIGDGGTDERFFTVY